MSIHLQSNNLIAEYGIPEVAGMDELESQGLSFRSRREELLLHDAIILADEGLKALSDYLSFSLGVKEALERVIAFPIRVLPAVYCHRSEEYPTEAVTSRASGSLVVLDQSFILVVDEDYLAEEAKAPLTSDVVDWQTSVREVATTINHERIHLLANIFWNKSEHKETSYRSYLVSDGGISNCRATDEALAELFAVISTLPDLAVKAHLPESREQFDLFAYEQHGEAIRTILADRLWVLRREDHKKELLSELFDSYLLNCSSLVEVAVNLSEQS